MAYALGAEIAQALEEREEKSDVELSACNPERSLAGKIPERSRL
jgi:hypothetical protein